VVDYVVDQIVGGGEHDCDDENCNEHGHHHRP
jgi:histidyl-tRNA synthetase